MIHGVTGASPSGGPRCRTGMGCPKSPDLRVAPYDSPAEIPFRTADRARSEKREDEDPGGHERAPLRASRLAALTPEEDARGCLTAGATEEHRVRRDSGMRRRNVTRPAGWRCLLSAQEHARKTSALAET